MLVGEPMPIGELARCDSVSVDRYTSVDGGPCAVPASGMTRSPVINSRHTARAGGRIRVSPGGSVNRLFELDEQRTFFDGGPRRRENRFDAARGLCAKLVPHLPRFHDDESLPRLHLVADIHV